MPGHLGERPAQGLDVDEAAPEQDLAERVEPGEGLGPHRHPVAEVEARVAARLLHRQLAGGAQGPGLEEDGGERRPRTDRPAREGTTSAHPTADLEAPDRGVDADAGRHGQVQAALAGEHGDGHPPVRPGREQRRRQAELLLAEDQQVPGREAAPRRGSCPSRAVKRWSRSGRPRDHPGLEGRPVPVDHGPRRRPSSRARRGAAPSSSSEKPSGPTRCSRQPVTAQVRATLPVLGGICGATSTTSSGGVAGSRSDMARDYPLTGAAARDYCPAMRLAAIGASDVGLKRRHNEDAFLVMPEAGLFAVADGLGGHASGEVASRMAVEHLAALLRRPRTGLPGGAAPLRLPVGQPGRLRPRERRPAPLRHGDDARRRPLRRGRAARAWPTWATAAPTSSARGGSPASPRTTRSCRTSSDRSNPHAGGDRRLPAQERDRAGAGDEGDGRGRRGARRGAGGGPRPPLLRRPLRDAPRPADGRDPRARRGARSAGPTSCSWTRPTRPGRRTT